MARHFDLGNDRDVTGLSIGNHPLNVLLGVVTSIASTRAPGWARLRIQPKPDAIAPSPDLGQTRVALDLDPPTLVIREMPVKCVQLMQRHQIQETLDFAHAE